MAKSKSFFGLRRGSTKSLTFSVYEGQQVTKDRVTEVKNPRTPSQMEQRMHMATALAMYSAGKEIFDHSFQGVTYGAKSMNKFLAENVKLIRDNYLANGNKFQENVYQNKAALAGQYLISDGTIAPYINSNVAFDESSSSIQTVIGVGETLTLGAIKAFLGLSSGDYLTTIALGHGTPSITIGTDVQYSTAQFGFLRMYIPEGADETAITAENINSVMTFERRVLGNVTLISTGSGVTTQWKLKISVPADWAEADAVGAIKSAKINGVWARSKQTMKYSYAAGVVTLSEALQTYPMGQPYVLNGGDVE